MLNGNNISYKTFSDNPVSVELVANATDNKNCSDSLLVNFTCEVSQANPPVESYQLFKSQEIVDTSSRGTWIENISSKGDHIYSCRALHSLGSVTSSDAWKDLSYPKCWCNFPEQKKLKKRFKHFRYCCNIELIS